MVVALLNALAPIISWFVRRRRAPRFAGPLALHCGCGNVIFPGWVNIDLAFSGMQLLPNRPKPDLLTDLTRPIPLPSGSATHVYANNFLEHLSYVHGERFLREAARLLRRGGVIRIVVPDIRKYAEGYVSDDISFVDEIRASSEYWPDHADVPLTLLDTIVRGSASNGWVHCASYDWELLSRKLHQSGFNNVRRCSANASDDPRLRNIDGNLFACVIAEAEKV